MVAAKRLVVLGLAVGAMMAGGDGVSALSGGIAPAYSGAAVAGEAEEKMVDLIVRLHDDLAAAVQGKVGGDTRATAELNEVLGSFGAELRPLYPATSDAELSTYFTISGLSGAQAERLINRLRDLSGVEAAYTQPPASPA